MKVNYLNLKRENLLLIKKLKKKLVLVSKKSEFIGGDELEKFEKKFASFIGTKYAVGVSSGTSALYLSLKCIGVNRNSEVITVANTWTSTVGAIILAGAKPKLVDVDESLNIDIKEVECKITSKTKAIIPVHLTGNPARMRELKLLAKKKKIKIIEDAAQAIGAEINRKKVGSFGDLGCFSFHPLKNLSALGDGGIITTNSKKYYNWLKIARNVGHFNRDDCRFWSFNMRLDNLQAGFLNEKFSQIEKINNIRNFNARIYMNNLNQKFVKLPIIKDKNYCVYHLFVVRVKQRTELIEYLKKKRIEVKIHYPLPIHKLKSSKNYFYKVKLKNTEKLSKEILSLPINQYLKLKEILWVCKQINNFYEKKN
jgi:dTDP-4-amino-4,6-dideoxygalactose transaminase